MGYDYAYVSKLFKKKVQIGFNGYVNILRINEGKRLLKNTTKSITEIAGEVGFSCVRSFNRSFFSVTGKSPSDYRKKI
jgi:YesN/AraC family two-component response regulator